MDYTSDEDSDLEAYGSGTSGLLASLSSEINEKNKYLEALEREYQETDVSLQRMMEQTEQQLHSYNQEIKKMQQRSVEHTQKIVEENKKLRLDLESMTHELDAKSKQLDELAAQTDCDGRNLKLEKQRFLQGLGGQTSGQENIGTRRIGELDSKAFLNVRRQKFPKDDAEVESVKICSKWQNEIKNPEWHPFMTAMVNGKESEVIREDDMKLKELKDEYGEEAYCAVVRALIELNGSGSRVPFPELWNHREGRKAKSKEAVQHAIKLFKATKRRR